MVRPALPAIAVALLVLLAGCSGLPPGVDSEPAAIDPSITRVVSTEGRCVDTPHTGFVIESIPNDDGTRTITIGANVTVSSPQYSVNETNLTQTGPDAYRLDVNTTHPGHESPDECEEGGIVPYEVTLVVPDTDSFELRIRHDGRAVGGIGSGTET